MTTNSPNQFPEEWLSAYLDDELNEEQGNLVEVAVAQNPQLAQLLDELRATRQLVRQLPSFPNTVAQRLVNSPTKTWTTELNDGLDNELSDGLDDNSVDSATTGSLSTSSEVQLNRTLADEGDNLSRTVMSRTVFRKHLSPWRIYRWVVLAASIAGIAFLASVLWPSKDGPQLGAKPERNLSKQLTDGRGTGDPLVDESLAQPESSSAPASSLPIEAGQPDSVATTESSDRQDKAGSMESRSRASLAPKMIDSPDSTPAAPVETPTDPSFALNLQPAPTAMSGLGAGGIDDAKSSESYDKTPATDLPGQAQLQPSLRGVDTEMLNPKVKEQEKQAAQSLDVIPAPFSTERSNELSQLGRAEPKRSAQSNRAAGLAAPKQAPSGSVATKATWHRSDAWTDDSVVGQLETNTMLLPLRSMLRGSYKTEEKISPVDQSIPIVILRADEQMRKEMLGKLQSIVMPALPETSDSATRVIFLSQDELDEVLGNSIKPEDLFRVAPAKQDAASQQRILILNQR